VAEFKLNKLLSSALLARMRQDAPGEDWPTFVTRAVESRLAAIERIRERSLPEVFVPQTAIERLRKSRERYENEEYLKGYEAGLRWAEADAEWDELQRVCQMVAEGRHLASDPWRDLLRAMAPRGFNRLEDPERSVVVLAGWRKACGSAEPASPLAVAGFAVGADLIGREVSGELL
jgi:hypothetical protein